MSGNMARKDDILVGLTGSFGSGCTEVAKTLKDKFGFEIVKLSSIIAEENDVVKEEEKKLKNRGVRAYHRNVMQNAGNRLRRDNKDRGYLAKKALEKIGSGEALGQRKFVFDGIRNLGEIYEFRRHSSKFVLIAVDCPKKERFKRLDAKSRNGNHGYPGGESQFEEDNERDREDKDKEYGQQVQICVDNADIVIRNDEPKPLAEIRDHLEKILERYMKLIEGIPERPSPEEHYMNMAYTAALYSSCMRRQVGAVVVKENRAVAVSCNENPVNLGPCKIEFGKEGFDGCRKDQLRFKEMEECLKRWSIDKCPQCKSKIPNPPESYCDCGYHIAKYLFPSKGTEHCTALHAEERALLHCFHDLQGAELYTTTFPCMECAKKTIDRGIKIVYFVEPYPSSDYEFVLELFKRHEVAPVAFKGVKGRAYHELFRGWHLP